MKAWKRKGPRWHASTHDNYPSRDRPPSLKTPPPAKHPLIGALRFMCFSTYPHARNINIAVNSLSSNNFLWNSFTRQSANHIAIDRPQNIQNRKCVMEQWNHCSYNLSKVNYTRAFCVLHGGEPTLEELAKKILNKFKPFVVMAAFRPLSTTKLIQSGEFECLLPKPGSEQVLISISYWFLHTKEFDL